MLTFLWRIVTGKNLLSANFHIETNKFGVRNEPMTFEITKGAQLTELSNHRFFFVQSQII